MKKRALVTGITGMDGVNITQFLIEKGYEIYGIARRVSNKDMHPIKRAVLEHPSVTLIHGDLIDACSISRAFELAEPHEVYHFGAHSFVGNSWESPAAVVNINTIGTIRVLEQSKKYGSKFYNAATSEMFGKVKEIPQKETTPFHPRSPYGVSKVGAFFATLNYRESYGMFACSGILFNHEDSIRSHEFITRKITLAASEIAHGYRKKIGVGNLEAKRDWGWSKDYVRACYLMLQADRPDDYVIATGQTRTVRELCQTAFSYLNLNWEDHVYVDQRFVRPAEVDILIGDYSKAKQVLGWEPSITFEEMIEMMVKSDYDLVSKYGPKLSKDI